MSRTEPAARTSQAPLAISAVVLIVCLFTAGANFVYHWNVLDRIQSVEQTLNQGSNMTTITSKWTSGGVERSITSTMMDSDETIEAFLKRHAKEAAAALEQFPIDP